MIDRNDFIPPLKIVDLPKPEFTVSPIGWVVFHEGVLYKVLSQEGDTVHCREVTNEEAAILASAIHKRGVEG